jgi:hypothetical protein
MKMKFVKSVKQTRYTDVAFQIELAGKIKMLLCMVQEHDSEKVQNICDEIYTLMGNLDAN